MIGHARRRFVRALVVALPLALGAWTGTSRAASPESDVTVEQARTLFNAGAQAFGAGRYPEAVQAFEAAYKLSPRPAIVFSIAQSARKQYYVSQNVEDLRHAIRAYREYVAKVEQGGRRADAVDALMELEAVSRKVDPLAAVAPSAAPVEKARTRIMVTSTSEAATASLDGGKEGPLPLIEEVTPGPHRVHLRGTGYAEEDRDFVAIEGTVVALDVSLHEQPARVQVDGPRGADILVDGQIAGTTPLAAPLAVPPGRHTLVVVANGHRAYAEDLVLRRAEARTVTARLEASPQRVISYVVLGTSALTLGTAAVLVGLSIASEDEARGVRDARALGNITAADLARYDDALGRRDSLRTAAGATLGAGGALFLAGAALYLFDRPSVTPRAVSSGEPAASPAPPLEPAKNSGVEMSWTPLVGPGVSGAAVFGRF